MRLFLWITHYGLVYYVWYLEAVVHLFLMLPSEGSKGDEVQKSPARNISEDLDQWKLFQLIWYGHYLTMQCLKIVVSEVICMSELYVYTEIHYGYSCWLASQMTAFPVLAILTNLGVHQVNYHFIMHWYEDQHIEKPMLFISKVCGCFRKWWSWGAL